MVISGTRWPSEGTHQWQSDLVQKEELGRGRIAGRRPSILVTFQCRQGERPKELLWGPRRRGERMHAGRAVQRDPKSSTGFQTVPQGSTGFHRVPNGSSGVVKRVISGHQWSSAVISGHQRTSGVVKRVSVRSKRRSWAAVERRRHNSDLAVPDKGGNPVGGHQPQSAAISGGPSGDHQRVSRGQSAALSCTQLHSAVFRGN